jgi:translation initiation factor 1
MSEICTICGLPKELCVCEQIARENARITAKLITKKFGKKYTIIEGVDQKGIDLKDVTKKLKNKFACGGTSKDGYIELQGHHLKKVREALIELGFAPETIDIT